MRSKVRYLLNRNGRYYARLVIPPELRPRVGKTELRVPLGPDYRTALHHLPGAVATLQHKVALAEASATPKKGGTPARYPMAPNELALASYRSR